MPGPCIRLLIPAVEASDISCAGHSSVSLDCQPAAPALVKVHDPISGPTQTPPSAPPFGLPVPCAPVVGGNGTRAHAAAHDESGPYGGSSMVGGSRPMMRAAAPVPRLSARVLSLSSTTPTYILLGLLLLRTRTLNPDPPDSRSPLLLHSAFYPSPCPFPSVASSTVSGSYHSQWLSSPRHSRRLSSTLRS